MGKLYHRFAEDGSYVEDIIVEAWEDVPADCTEIHLPVPNYKPKFDKEQNEWIETITEEELAKFTNIPIIPSDEDRIAQLEAVVNSLLLEEV